MGKTYQLYTIKGHWNEVIEVVDPKGQVIFSWNREKLIPNEMKLDNSHRNSSTLLVLFKLNDLLTCLECGKMLVMRFIEEIGIMEIEKRPE
jgi:hypothetical protein